MVTVMCKHLGNHLKVEDLKNNSMQTYDNDIALIFDMLNIDAKDFSMNFVGVLNNIFKFDYGPMHTPMIIFRCEWMKWKDNWGKLTYVWNEAGFLTIFFSHKFPLSSKPFIFPCQKIQVFFQMTSKSQVGKLYCGKKLVLAGRW